jgi:hypothetical protein
MSFSFPVHVNLTIDHTAEIGSSFYVNLTVPNNLPSFLWPLDMISQFRRQDSLNYCVVGSNLLVDRLHSQLDDLKLVDNDVWRARVNNVYGPDWNNQSLYLYVCESNTKAVLARSTSPIVINSASRLEITKCFLDILCSLM